MKSEPLPWQSKGIVPLKTFSLLVAFLALGLFAANCAPRRVIRLYENSDDDIYEFAQCTVAEAELVIEAKVVRPSPMSTISRTFEFKRQPDSIHRGIHSANGSWAACGSKDGHGGYVSLNSVETEADADTAIDATVSVYWNYDGVHGEAKGTIQIPWLGQATHEIGEGVSIQVRMFRVDQPSDES